MQVDRGVVRIFIVCVLAEVVEHGDLGHGTTQSYIRTESGRSAAISYDSLTQASSTESGPSACAAHPKCCVTLNV